MKIYDINCEIYARIYRGVAISKNYREFLENTKSRNLSNKRVERIILNILLNIKAEMMDFEINYVRILGFDKKGQKYLKKIRENNNFEDIEGKNNFEKKNIFVNWKDIEKFRKFFENNENMENSENIKNFKIQENFWEKIKIEKNGFLLKELFLEKREKLNPIVYLNNQN